MASLPEAPAGRELEDFIAAALQTGRYFVEKGVTEQEGDRQILELDVIATTYERRRPVPVIFEVKGGENWSRRDLFTLLGWMRYLDVQKGVFVVTRASGEAEMKAIRRRFGPRGVRRDPRPGLRHGDRGAPPGGKMAVVSARRSMALPTRTHDLPSAPRRYSM